MPTWTLEYQIGSDTYDDFLREQQVFRSDPLCVSYQSTDSADYPGRISVRVEFRESVGGASLQILQRRLAQAVPAVRANPVTWNGNRYEVQMSTEGPQEGQLLIGAPVSVDEHGRLGTRGTTIGIITQVDMGNHLARIVIEPGTPLDVLQSPNPMRMEGYEEQVVFSRADLEAAQVRMNRSPYPLPSLDREAFRARQQQMADEDARAFAAMDAIGRGEIPLPMPAFQKEPEPRPTFKTRYERIMDTLKGK